MRIVFSKRARRQLESLFTYLAPRAGPRSARGYVDRIIASCEGLSDHPHRGTRREDILPGLRIFGFERRVTIAFVVEEHAVVIVGVFYGGQDYETALRSGGEGTA